MKKNIIQKLIAIILSITGMVTSFVGCSNSGAEKEETTTSIVETTDIETTTDVVEEKTLLDDAKYDEVREEIKTIQEGLHIPDKYMEILEVLDSFAQIILKNENYLETFETKKYELTANVKDNEVYYTSDKNISYNVLGDELVVFDVIHGQKTKKTVSFLESNSNCYSVDCSVAYNGDGKLIEGVVATNLGLDHANTFSNDNYTQYLVTSSYNLDGYLEKSYIQWVYNNKNIEYYILMSRSGINITKLKRISDDLGIFSEYAVTKTAEYDRMQMITDKFDQRNHEELKSIIKELIETNSPKWYELYHTCEGEEHQIKLILEDNRILAKAPELEDIKNFEIPEGTEDWLKNYIDWDIEYELTNDEEYVLKKYIVNGDCEGAIKYIEKLDEKYRKSSIGYAKTLFDSNNSN